MRARFAADPKVAAGFSPLGSMRRDPVAAGAELREQMSQLVPQSAFNLRRVMFAQAWIQRNELAAKISAARGAEKSRVPLHPHGAREFRGIKGLQHFPRLSLELEIAAEHDEHRAGRKGEIELFKRHRLRWWRSIWPS